MILVNGGTGFIGGEIVRKLVASGLPVRVMTRNPEKGEALFGDSNVEFVKGDVRDRKSLESAMAGVNTVVNCLQHDGYPVERPGRGLTFPEVDGAGTALQVETAVHAGVKSFIYMSGAGAGEGREESWFKGKEIAEKAVRECGLRYTIFRPTWVYGPGDRSVNRFVWFVRKLPFVPVIGDGSQKVQPLYVKDLAEIAAAAADGRGPADCIIQAGGPQVFTMRELLEKIMQVLGRRKPILSQPVTLMKLAAGLLQYIPGIPISPGMIDFALQEAVVDNSRLLAAFPVALTGFEDGFRKYAH